jgi:catechol 2,3-dioxygenase-like lactoylglutathione lyase family enzyme
LKGLTLIGYVTLGTNDVKRAAAFYDAVLAHIGATRCREQEMFVAWRISPGQPELCLIQPYDGNEATVGNGVMVGIPSGTPEKIHAAYYRAIELGAQDEGPPGLREYSPGFYAGYVRDLDGNKLVFYCIEKPET